MLRILPVACAIALLSLAATVPASAQLLTAGSRVSVSSDSGTIFDRSPDPGGITISSANEALGGFDSYFASAFSRPGYGTLAASASLQWMGHRTRFGGQLGQAVSSAGFEDEFTIDAPGLAGQSGTAALSIALNGRTTESAPEGVFTSAGGGITVVVAGEIGSVRAFDPFSVATIPFDFVYGEAFDIDANLGVDVRATAPANTFDGVDGSVSALFGNTAGITSLTVFDVDMNEIDYSLTTASGEFEFYDPIPEPSTALLLGLGLVGLAKTSRRGA